MKKIRCPLHDDRVPSLAIYETHAFCFGGCGMLPLSILGIEAVELQPGECKEDVAETLKYVDQLQLMPHRGFEFPTDLQGFYIVWPDRSFYKKRIFEPGDRSKYMGPKGCQAPPFWVRKLDRNRSVFVVEGELNALSIAKAYPDCSVMSPGSASEFLRKKTLDLLTGLCKYANILVVVDDDTAGMKAAIAAASRISAAGGSVQLSLMKPDANEILNTDGTEEIKRQVLRGMPG